ncbi:MAG: HDIG domain-containing protein, partial [Deltaproteobacteria bacterium]|nr:HDIG domain-containing protein [Deltaproteobacteria bacterium]
MSAPPPGSQAQLAAVIPRRPRVGALTSVLLSLIFAALFAPIVLADRWLSPPITVGAPAPITIRVPAFQGVQAPGIAIRGGGVVVARGEIIDPAHADAVAAARASVPHGTAPWFAYLAIAMALTLLYTLHLRRNHRGRLLRVQLVHLGLVLAVAIVTKIALLLSPMSVLVIPVSLAAVVPTLVFDRTVGLATGVWASILLSFLVPFDVGVSAVMVVQAATAALLVPERHDRPWRLALGAGVVSAVAAGVTYGAFHYLSSGSAPFHELRHPLSSAWAAAAIGGLIAAVAAVPLIPLYELMVGEITQGTLVRHENMSHPLLRQIAEKSPGTWQHSLAMANMAEIAANAIGANGRLVRVGAYFHDLGKSLQPTYFIENLEPGQSSPHDRLPPEVSCDAIFAHVTEGIAVARRAKLPERIIDFMHMHHGDGVLEYFWAKCQDQGNPKHLPQAAFRYPGHPPQSRETAILAICDAVEAASRTLKRPDERSIENLVQRIVYGKLHLGQLDESGLSMADLRKISDSLRETIKHAHHGRIEYPWQKEAEAEASASASADVNAETHLARPRAVTVTGKYDEPRLDSLDAPRPHWGARPRRETDARTVAAPTGPTSGPLAVADAASSAPTLMAIPSPRAGSLTGPPSSTATAAMAATATLRREPDSTQPIAIIPDREDGAPLELAPVPVAEIVRDLAATGPIAPIARPMAELVEEPAQPEPLPAAAAPTSSPAIAPPAVEVAAPPPAPEIPAPAPVPAASP